MAEPRWCFNVFRTALTLPSSASNPNGASPSVLAQDLPLLCRPTYRFFRRVRFPVGLRGLRPFGSLPLDKNMES